MDQWTLNNSKTKSDTKIITLSCKVLMFKTKKQPQLVTLQKFHLNVPIEFEYLLINSMGTFQWTFWSVTNWDFYYLLVAGCTDDGPASNRPLFDADSPALGSSNLSIITFRFSSLTFFSFPLASTLDSGAGEPDLESKKFLEQCFAF